ncbi:protein rep, partial [Acinetobacter baumannii]|nr:replication protein [Escherichia coli]EKV1720218.1 replication protein [Acinetobacter baumannii]
KKQKDLGYAKAAAEVCKYALKFGDLSVENTWEAFKVLKGKRLSGAFGSLYGVKIPENLADEMPDENDLPYLEMLYKFVFGKQSYYNLEMTRHVEPQVKDNDDDEKELRRREGEGGRKFVAIKDDVRSEKELADRPTRPTRVRKKQHWQVLPATRVRVKKRIRRWDGYLCVIHM